METLIAANNQKVSKHLCALHLLTDLKSASSMRVITEGFAYGLNINSILFLKDRHIDELNLLLGQYRKLKDGLALSQGTFDKNLILLL